MHFFLSLTFILVLWLYLLFIFDLLSSLKRPHWSCNSVNIIYYSNYLIVVSTGYPALFEHIFI